METMKTLRILGKRGRMTVPQEVRDEIGLERGDVVSFAVVNEDSVLVKRERLCENCVTETNQTDMMKLLVQAMHFAKPEESAQDAFEFLTDLLLRNETIGNVRMEKEAQQLLGIMLKRGKIRARFMDNIIRSKRKLPRMNTQF